MNIRKFNMENDYDKVIEFLRGEYKNNHNMECWLPQRFDDLVFRIDCLYHDERGLLRSKDFIYLFLEDEEIVGVIIPDGDSFNSCIKKGFESVFSKMLDLAEKELLPLFKKDEDGYVDFFSYFT